MAHRQGRAAVVTGGSHGVGQALVLALLSDGYSVAALARGEEGLATLRAEAGAGERLLTVAGDVSAPADVSRLMAAVDSHFGRLDVLINNAGIGSRGPAADLAIEDWDRVLAVNLRGPFLCARAAIPLLRRSGGGNIINIGSGAGKQGYAGMAAYCASKFGLQGLSESLAAELGDEGIKVTLLNPGSIKTGFGSGGGKMLSPEDVASAVLYLLGQSALAWTAEMNLWPFRAP